MIIDDRPVMVTIQCMTYNHGPYIRQCLEGFVMQKTNFRFEAIVHDDASTDSTVSIIKEYSDRYPELIKPIFETENQYSKQNNSLDSIMLEHTRGKYVAFCEGDDYWTDPLKLQKQIDFMEAHGDYVLSFTDVQEYIEKDKIFGAKQSELYGEANRQIELGGKDAFYKIILKESNIQTLSAIIRKDVLIAREVESINFLMGDTPLWLHCSQIGKIKYFEDCTGIYRNHVGSVTHNLAARQGFIFSMYEMRIFYCLKYGYDIPRIIKIRYNKALLKLKVNGNNIGREPLYKQFPMNLIQTKVYHLAMNLSLFYFFVKMMWQIERIVGRIIKHKVF